MGSRPPFRCDAITFDCYGTLVQWRERSAEILSGILTTKDATVAPGKFLDVFHEIRHSETDKPYRPYKAILSASLQKTLASFGLDYAPEDGDHLITSLKTINPFPETKAVLTRLRPRHKIAIISNSDRDLIAGTVDAIGVPFDGVFVAEDAQAYKPSLALFHYALRALNVESANVVHMGASMPLDMQPATKLGLAKIWINRLSQTPDPRWEPCESLTDLNGLPSIITKMSQSLEAPQN